MKTRTSFLCLTNATRRDNVGLFDMHTTAWIKWYTYTVNNLNANRKIQRKDQQKKSI